MLRVWWAKRRGAAGAGHFGLNEEFGHGYEEVEIMLEGSTSIFIFKVMIMKIK